MLVKGGPGVRMDITYIHSSSQTTCQRLGSVGVSTPYLCSHIRRRWYIYICIYVYIYINLDTAYSMIIACNVQQNNARYSSVMDCGLMRGSFGIIFKNNNVIKRVKITRHYAISELITMSFFSHFMKASRDTQLYNPECWTLLLTRNLPVITVAITFLFLGQCVGNY